MPAKECPATNPNAPAREPRARVPPSGGPPGLLIHGTVFHALTTIQLLLNSSAITTCAHSLVAILIHRPASDSWHAVPNPRSQAPLGNARPEAPLPPSDSMHPVERPSQAVRFPTSHDRDTGFHVAVFTHLRQISSPQLLRWQRSAENRLAASVIHAPRL